MNHRPNERVLEAEPRTRIGFVALLVAVTSMSQFYRAMIGPIGPEISERFELSTSELALAGTAFFAALLILQLPVGVLFDRFNPPRITGAFMVLAAVGCLLCGYAKSFEVFIAGRVLIGAGMAAAFMAAVVMLSARVTDAELGLELAKVFALSNLGTLFASKPLVFILQQAGWSLTHVVVATVTVGIAILLVRQTDGVERRDHENLQRASLRTVVEVFKLPGVRRLLPLLAISYAAVITVLGVWSGRYLSDVHGAGIVVRGNVQLAMATAQILGIFVYGWLDGRIGRRRDLAIAGGYLAALSLIGLVVLSEHLWISSVCLTLFCFAGSYNVLMLAYARTALPAKVAGRGMTAINLIPGLGSAFLPMVLAGLATMTLWIQQDVIVVYGVLFACLALLLVAGAVSFTRAPKTPGG